MVFIPATGVGKTADCTIDAEVWELKSLSGGSEDAVARNLRKGVKQADSVVLDITDSPLDEEQVKRLVEHYGRRYNLNAVRAIRGVDEMDWRWRPDDE